MIKVMNDLDKMVIYASYGIATYRIGCHNIIATRICLGRGTQHSKIFMYGVGGSIGTTPPELAKRLAIGNGSTGYFQRISL